MIKTVSTGYTPRQFQADIHKNLRRFNVLVCHRRFGKTHLSINEIIDQALRNTKKSPQYAYIAPTYGAAKRIAWDLIKQYTKYIPGVTYNEADLRVEIPRPASDDKIKIWLLGAENPDTLRGIYLDGVVLDEFAEMNPTVWTAVIRPTLSDRLGWAIFIGTPKGENHFYEVYNFGKDKDTWYTAMFKASQTNIIAVSELEEARAVMDESEYMQEYECSFSAALVGAYYGKEMEKAQETGRICGVPYDPSVPVYTAWDLGIDDSTAIWIFQLVGREVHVIEYIEDAGLGLEHYVSELKSRDYMYEEHLLPHDAAAKELGTGKTRVETLKKLGLRRVKVVPRQNVADGISAARLLIRRCWFDLDKTARGISALKNYERKWDAKNKIFLSTPLHNWASHGADAFRTLAMGLREEVSEESRKKLPRIADNKFDFI